MAKQRIILEMTHILSYLDNSIYGIHIISLSGLDFLPTHNYIYMISFYIILALSHALKIHELGLWERNGASLYHSILYYFVFISV